MFSDDRKKLTLWGRQSTYVGGPSVVNARKSTINNSRARSADARCFGFGSGTSRFTIIQSSPASPMVDKASMFWYLKDIDIEGGGSGANSSKNVRKRSRHDCHFPPGTCVPLGKNVQAQLGSSKIFSSISIFPFCCTFLCQNIRYTFGSFAI